MPDQGFLDRFKNLEIPEAVDGVDWRFLDAAIDLPPMPLEEHALLFLVDDRVFVPEDRAPHADDARVFFHVDWHALGERDAPATLEAAWRREHERTLVAAGKRFWDSVPASIVRDPALVARAREVLVARQPGGDAGGADAGGSPSVLARLVARSRIARLKEKLFDLVTLREYVGIFEKAIEPDLLARLRALPETAAPEELLVLLEGALDRIHAKARSPLRNKLLTTRAVVSGVTLLPLYREPATGLFDAYRLLVERELKIDVLSRRGT